MPKKIIQVPIDEALLKELDSLSHARGVSRAQFIRESCESYARTAREEEMDRAYAEGYRKYPEDEAWGELGAKLLAENTENEEW
jgi:metal-responsive CopG/Arc/MetJ family transcriptional regulator